MCCSTFKQTSSLTHPRRHSLIRDVTHSSETSFTHRDVTHSSETSITHPRRHWHIRDVACSRHSNKTLLTQDFVRSSLKTFPTHSSITHSSKTPLAQDFVTHSIFFDFKKRNPSNRLSTSKLRRCGNTSCWKSVRRPTHNVTHKHQRYNHHWPSGGHHSPHGGGKGPDRRESLLSANPNRTGDDIAEARNHSSATEKEKPSNWNNRPAHPSNVGVDQGIHCHCHCQRRISSRKQDSSTNWNKMQHLNPYPRDQSRS